MNPEEIFICGLCEKRFGDYYDAQSCCEPEVTTIFKCGHCHTEHHIQIQAENCCGDIDPDAPPIADQAELEAAGQIRINL